MKAREAGQRTSIVTTPGGVVLGRIRIDRLGDDSEALAEDVMESGPTTTRADTTLESMQERFQARNVDSILVATSDGRLVGTLYRTDVETNLTGIKTESTQPTDDETCCCCKD